MRKVLVVQMMKMMEAEREREEGQSRTDVFTLLTETAGVGTYDGEDERVGEVAVEGELHHVPAQPQQLHGLGQTPEDVSAGSRTHTHTAALKSATAGSPRSDGPAGGDRWTYFTTDSLLLSLNKYQRVEVKRFAAPHTAPGSESAAFTLCWSGRTRSCDHLLK